MPGSEGRWVLRELCTACGDAVNVSVLGNLGERTPAISGKFRAVDDYLS
jgi:hypothetical protein